MPDLTISLVQTKLAWHDPAANRQHVAAQLAAALPGPGATDLVVLPEMFTTGFTMDATQAEPTDGPTLAWLREQATRYDAVVTGSVLLTEGGRCYNRLLWVRPDGSFSHYDKRHLFRLAGEHEVYAAGTAPLVEEWRGWRIRPLICYDLRFPVWSRNRAAAPYDLLLYVANWPAVRRHPWQALLPARAIENLAYTAGVNRIGTDHNGHHYAGDSVLLNMRGEVLAEAGDHAMVLTHTLSAAALREFRAKFAALLDADEFELSGGEM